MDVKVPVIPSSLPRSGERNEEGRGRVVKEQIRVDHAHRFLERISGILPKSFPANQASNTRGMALLITGQGGLCYGPDGTKTLFAG